MENPAKASNPDDDDGVNRILGVKSTKLPPSLERVRNSTPTFQKSSSPVGLSAWNKKFGGSDDDNIGTVLSIESPATKLNQLNRKLGISPVVKPKMVIHSQDEAETDHQKKELMKKVDMFTPKKPAPISLSSENSPRHRLVRCKNCNKKLLYPTGACVVMCVCRTVIQVSGFGRRRSSGSESKLFANMPRSSFVKTKAPSAQLSTDLLPPTRKSKQVADPSAETEDSTATDGESEEEEQALKQLLGSIMHGQPQVAKGSAKASTQQLPAGTQVSAVFRGQAYPATILDTPDNGQHYRVQFKKGNHIEKVARADITEVKEPTADVAEAADARLDALFRKKNFMKQPLKRRLLQYDLLLRKELHKRAKQWDKNSGTKQSLEELWVARKQQLRRFGLYAQLLPVFEQMQMLSQLRWEQIQRMDKLAGEILAARLQEIAALSRTVDHVTKKRVSVFSWTRKKKKKPDPPPMQVDSSFFKSVEELLERDSGYGALVTFLEDLDEKLVDAAAAVKACEPQMGKKSRAQRLNVITEAISSRAEAQHIWHSKRAALLKLDRKPSTPIKFRNGTADLKLCPSRASEQALEDAQLKFNSIVLDERFSLGKDFAGVKRNIQSMTEPLKPDSILGLISWLLGVISTRHFKGCLGHEEAAEAVSNFYGIENNTFGSPRHSLRALSESLVLQDPVIHRNCMAMYFEEQQLQDLDLTWQKNLLWLQHESPKSLGVRRKFLPADYPFQFGTPTGEMTTPTGQRITDKQVKSDPALPKHGSGWLQFRSLRRQGVQTDLTPQSARKASTTRRPYTAATIAFNKFGAAMYRGPYPMMERLLEAFTVLQLEAVEMATANGHKCAALGAEDILPIVIFSLVHSTFNRMNTALQFASDFGYVQDSSWEATDGEAAYFLVTLSAAVSWITSQDQEKGVDASAESSPGLTPSVADTPPPAYSLDDTPPPTYRPPTYRPDGTTPTTTSDTPGVETVASTDTPGVETVASTDTPGVETVARTDTPGVETAASADTPGVETVASTDTLGVEKVVSNDTPGVETVASTEPPPPPYRSDVPTPTPTSDTPGVETVGSADTPGVEKVASTDTPGVETVASTDTPGVETVASTDTPGVETVASTDTPGVETVASTDTPGVEKVTSNDTPGFEKFTSTSSTPGVEKVILTDTPETIVLDTPSPPPAENPLPSLAEVMRYVHSIDIHGPDREYHSPRSKVGGGVTLILVRIRALVVARFGEATWQRYQEAIHDFFQRDQPDRFGLQLQPKLLAMTLSEDSPTVFKDSPGAFKDTPGAFKDTPGAFKDTPGALESPEPVPTAAAAAAAAASGAEAPLAPTRRPLGVTPLDKEILFSSADDEMCI